MGHQSGEVITLGTIDEQAVSAVRRDHIIRSSEGDNGEMVFDAFGEYAAHRSSDELDAPWRFASEREYTVHSADGVEDDHFKWATAEELRTGAGEGTFLASHMDLLDASLFARLTSAATKLIIANEAELSSVLQAYEVPLKGWTDTKLHDLYLYTRSNDPNIGDEVVENMTLHDVGSKLWLSTAQTMLNVFHQADDGQVYRLGETWKTIYDKKGNVIGEPKRSNIRSSMGENGHLIGDTPERSWDTARRCLREELSIEDDALIKRIVSSGCVLRRKPAGHHQFKPIATEDWTHYFNVELTGPIKVEEKYTNEEFDAEENLRARIILEWAKHDKGLPGGLRK